MIEQVLFVAVSVFILATAVIVVTNRNLFHAALALMASFLGVAGFYVLLEAGFLAAAQLLVYIGAISILIIFAIMMTRRMMQAIEPSFNSQMVWAVVAGVGTFALLGGVIWNLWPRQPDAGQLLAARTEVPESMIQGSIEALGRALVSADAYVLPFELASVLLLAALIGAIVVAWPRAGGPS